MSGHLTFGTITETLVTGIGNADSDLRGAIAAAGQQENLGPVDLLTLQKLVQEWMVMIEMTAAINKAFGDVMRGIVQKF